MSNEFGPQRSSKDLRNSLPVSPEVVDRDTPQLYEFGPFRLEPAERKLMRGTEMVTLTPKAFDTLLLLVRNSGHLLEKDDLIATLWPDTFVEEGSLSNNIFLLRKALGEDPAFIETVPKRGYRFVGAVRQLPHAGFPRLQTSLGGDREPTNEVSVEGRQVKHLVIPAIAVNVPRLWRTLVVIGLLIATMCAVGGVLWWRGPASLPDRSQWVPLTKLPDPVSQPALSPDGKMLVFIRSRSTFFAVGQVYVKILPDGEPAQLTHDGLKKMSPAFSADGSRIAYTVVDPQFNWETWVVPVLGGEPQRWLRNAADLVWTGSRQMLFSEIKKSPNMGIETSDENGNGRRDIYVPLNDRGMAHRAQLSPDGKWVLLTELGAYGNWEPCRIVPVAGGSVGRQVGPSSGGCTFGAWSPDGKWVYLTSKAGGLHHIWRQRFPDGPLQQLTSGPTEEEGIAMAPDGRSFVTAVALQNISVWVHDARGERQISLLEGNGAYAKFTPDGRKLCYRVVKEVPRFGTPRDPGEVWVADLDSGRSEPLAPGFQPVDYDISADGQQVVMETDDGDGRPRLWIASFERQSPPRPIPNVEGRTAKFGPSGEIFFRRVEGSSGFVYRVRSDGSGLRKALEQPVLALTGVSPDGRWIEVWAPFPDNRPAAVQVVPLDGGAPVVIGSNTWLQWSHSGDSLWISGGAVADGRTYIIPLKRGEVLPRIPAGGFRSEEEVAQLPGAHSIDAAAAPGPSPEVYTFYRSTTQRNLYRIPVP
jgi:DNA-binding winged helix-turn-helix (wHTH) protein/Tol biopolymer transport system component